MSGRRSRAVLCLVAGLLFCRPVLLAAESFSFSGDSTTMSLAEGGQHALLSGHGRVESRDLRITADSIELFGKDFIYAQAHGNVHVVDARRGLDLTSEELFYDRDRKIARIQGNATLADLKNEMVVKGGLIEDRDKEQITIMQIGVRIFKKDIVCRSEFARYKRDTKVLELSGMPWVSKGGDVYQAARITINLDTEDISLEGSVQGTLEDKGTQSGGSAAGWPSGVAASAAAHGSAASEELTGGAAPAPSGDARPASSPAAPSGDATPASSPVTPPSSGEASPASSAKSVPPSTTPQGAAGGQ